MVQTGAVEELRSALTGDGTPSMPQIGHMPIHSFSAWNLDWVVCIATCF